MYVQLFPNTLFVIEKNINVIKLKLTYYKAFTQGNTI